MVADAKVQQDSDTSRFHPESSNNSLTGEFHQPVGLPGTVEGGGGGSSCMLLGRGGGGMEAQ